MTHNKKRNITKLSPEEKKKLQKDMYKKQYAKSFKSSELQKTSEAIQINQNRFIAMLKSSKAAMVRVVVVRQIKSTTIRHFILTGIAEKRSNKAYYKHLIRQIK